MLLFLSVDDIARAPTENVASVVSVIVEFIDVSIANAVIEAKTIKTHELAAVFMRVGDNAQWTNSIQ